MYKLLIADDDIHTINGVKKLIQMTGLEIDPIIEAYNGMDGVELIRKHKPDIIFSDIQMPYMNGFEMIEAIRDMPNNPQIIMLTGFDDFNHAKRAIDANVLSYIVKPAAPDEVASVLKKAVEACEKQRKIQQKEDNIEKNINTIKQQIIKNLFLSAEYSKNDLDYFEQEYSIHLDNMKYCCISVHSKTGNTDNLIESLKEKYNIYSDDSAPNHINLLVTFDYDISDNSFCAELTKICKIFTDKMFISVGNLVKRVYEIPDSFKNANNMIKYAFCYDFSGFLYYEDFLHELKKFSSNPPSFNKQALIDAILSNNVHRLYEILEDMQSKFDSLSVFDPGYLKSLCFDFCNMIITTDIYSEKIDDANSLWAEIEKINCRTDIFLYCKNLLLDFENAVTNSNSVLEKDIVLKIQKYVEDNYADTITLTSLAHKLYYSRNYLAIIFKKYTGVEFRVYLQNYRMNKAAQLLMSSNYKLLEIAERVGYRDLKTFRQTFVKCYGVLPSEYVRGKTKSSDR